MSCDVNLTCNSSEFCVVNGILYDTAKTRIVSVINDINRIVDKNLMTFPPSVKEIGRFSFYEISSGGPVQLPPSVIYIGESAFEHTIISQIILNDKIVEIGKSAFCAGSSDNGVPSVFQTVLSEKTTSSTMTWYARVVLSEK